MPRSRVRVESASGAKHAAEASTSCSPAASTSRATLATDATSSTTRKIRSIRDHTRACGGCTGSNAEHQPARTALRAMNALTAAENDRRASRARHYHSAPRGTERMLAGSLLGLMLLVGASSVHAQARGDGARTYWKKPIDTHAVTTTFQMNTGNVGFNTDLPITGAVIESTVFIASYTAYFGLLGRTNMVTLALPAGTMSGHTTGVSPVAIDVATKGRADPVLSWDINLVGGPAMDVQEFASYRQRTIADFNVWITAPFGSHG